MNNIHTSWTELFNIYKIDLDSFYNNDEIVYPTINNIFKVFEMDVKDINVVLLGQDPYINENEAMGLSFSVPKEKKIPPSLLNIFKELKIEFPDRKYTFLHGDLSRWFYEEKIFLLNSSLTVIKGKSGSHLKLWEEFTNDVIKYIDKYNKKCVYVLLGNYAKNKEKFITNKKNIIKGVHPSPLSAHNGFFNSDIFKNIEKILCKDINWNL